MTQSDDIFTLLTSPLLFHCWAEECVLFNSFSGDTHQVPRTTVEVLERLAQEPAGAATLVTFFANDAAPAEVAQLHAEFQDLLGSLESLALITPVAL